MNARLKKALKRQSEIREALNAARGKNKGEDGHLEDEKRAEMEAESVKLETEIRAALDEPETRQSDPQFVRLADRIEARRYFNAAIEDRAVEGAELELLQELNLPDRNVIPWAAVEDRSVEDRQDVVTDVPDAAIGQPRQPILSRVFHRTDAAFVGAMMPSVPRGMPVYPVMTGGAAGGMVAPSAEQFAETATFTGQNVSPKRATARYVIRAEDAARFEGLESTLRADLRMVLGNLIDQQAISGDGQGSNLAGFISHAAAGEAASAGEGGIVNIGIVDAAIAGGIDGLYANEPGDVRFLLGTATMRKILAVRPHAPAGESDTLLSIFRMACGGIRATSRVPATSEKLQSMYRFVPNGLRFIVPVWEGMDLIRDPYSGAAKGEVAMTVIALYGALMVRNNGIQEVKLRLAA